jgi:multidrug efflux pump subunit AcrA (membrane-fusion protein)
VWVVDRANMTVKQQQVRVGGAEGNDVVLTGGLSAGETIVVAGVHLLTPGQKVRLYAERVNTASNGTVAAR